MSSSLRDAILESGEELAVETNQRSLIDKVLARYSGQFTVFRELLQNGDDAGASTVELHFKTDAKLPQGAPLPSLAQLLTTRIEVKNDGAPFSSDDWSRLRKIAEGNPDEQKIGAFGVGYYSVFSLTESPLVSSGSTAMLFVWKRDQLYVRQGPNTNADKDLSSDGRPWTTFDLALRQPEPMPAAEDFCRFLADALVFTVKLRTLRVYMDDMLLCELNKKLAPSSQLRPASNLNLRTKPLKMMTIRSVDVAPVQIDAKVMKWVTHPETQRKADEAAEAEAYSKRTVLSGATKFFSSFGFGSSKPASPQIYPAAVPDQPDLTAYTTSTVFLRIVNANIAVSVPRQLSAELERATKKKPPSQTVFAMLFNSADEFALSGAEAGQPKPEAHRLFAKLLTDLSRQGHVAIGFMTHQTTGYSSSIGARFIPTVERESLDLMNSHTADWNKELLYAGGILARVVYESQMAEFKSSWSASASEEIKHKQLSRFVHLAQFFTFTASTPSPVVSSVFEAAFYEAAPAAELSILSTEGPLPVGRVRLPDSTMQTFLKSTAVLPGAVAEQASGFMLGLQMRRLLYEINMEDVLRELRGRALEVHELQAALKWWLGVADQVGYSAAIRAEFINSAMFRISHERQGEVIVALNSVKHFLGSHTLLSRVPPPADALPASIARALKPSDLQRVFDWTSMPTQLELAYLFSPAITGGAAPIETNILETPHFAEEVLTTIAKNWSNFSAATQGAVASALKEQTCIPSSTGLRLPTEIYFDSVDSLQLDLAVVQWPSKKPTRGNLEKLLSAAGVRKHIDLQLIFTKLVAGGKMSHVELIKYLMRVEDSLTAAELDRLSKTAWLHKEGDDESAKAVKYKASDLYEPTQPLRLLKLPLLSWSGHFSEAEAKFMRSMGLKQHPSARIVLDAAADASDATRRQQALSYWLEHYGARYKKAAQFEDLAYVPAVDAEGKSKLAKPTQVYGNSLCSVLGFDTLASAYQADSVKLRVAQDPTPDALIAALLNRPPQTAGAATAIFSYLSLRVSLFSAAQLARLSNAPIVPVERDGQTHFRMPSICYFTVPTSPAIAAVFTSVDFGTPSRPFLAACGVRDSPNASEIAEMLATDAQAILKRAGSSEAYLDILRPIAAARHSLPAAVVKRLKTSPFFLTTIRVPTKEGTSSGLDEEEEQDSFELVTRLKKPSETVVVDDVNTGRLFGAYIHAAPEEDLLELFVESLGAVRVSDIVKDQHGLSKVVQGATEASQEIRELVLERTSLFLHERQATGDREVVYDMDWLTKHFKAQEVEKIEIHKSLNFAGQQHRVRQPASATAELTSSYRNTELTLYFSSSGIEDWFEVSSALCRHILAKQRVNDSLLLMTLLSTPLRVLQRRGFDTSRILKAKKIERQKQIQEQRDAGLREELAKPSPPSSYEIQSWATQLAQEFPGADREMITALLEAQESHHLEAVRQQLQKGYSRQQEQSTLVKRDASAPSQSTPGPPPSSRSSRDRNSLFSGIRRKIRGTSPPASIKDAPGQVHRPEASSSSADTPPPYSPVPSSSRSAAAGTASQPAETGTPYSDIRANVQAAIQASRSDASQSVQDQGQKRHIKESESGYCDSTPATNLDFVTSLAGHRFYVAKGVDASDILLQHRESLLRMAIQVLQPLAGVFGMRPEALHLFFDVSGPLIAFNKSGTIHVNLRYYLSWHDASVKAGRLEDALLSNYFTIAHELAHNLVGPHNAEHGFYTCSIAETHFTKLASLLASLKSRERPLINL